jgi:hypothetical protein
VLTTLWHLTIVECYHYRYLITLAMINGIICFSLKPFYSRFLKSFLVDLCTIQQERIYMIHNLRRRGELHQPHLHAPLPSRLRCDSPAHQRPDPAGQPAGCHHECQVRPNSIDTVHQVCARKYVEDDF